MHFIVEINYYDRYPIRRELNLLCLTEILLTLVHKTRMGKGYLKLKGIF